jgi:hypothetical protein
MSSKVWGWLVFALGAFCMHVLMTVNFWLIVLGIVPDATLYGIVSSTSALGGLAWGLGPPVGAALMVVGGFIYGRQGKEGVR